MDVTMRQILKNSLASLIRFLLTIIGTYLVTKNVLPSGFNDALNRHAGEIAMGLAAPLLAYGWSVWQKWHVNKKVDAALDAPKSTPRQDFELRLKYR